MSLARPDRPTIKEPPLLLEAIPKPVRDYQCEAVVAARSERQRVARGDGAGLARGSHNRVANNQMRHRRQCFLLLLACFAVFGVTAVAGDQARADAELSVIADPVASSETWPPSEGPNVHENDGVADDRRASVPVPSADLTEEPAVADDVFVPLRAWKEQKIQDIQLRVERKKEEENRALRLDRKEEDAEKRVGGYLASRSDRFRCHILHLVSRPFCVRNDTFGGRQRVTAESSTTDEISTETTGPNWTRINSHGRSSEDLYGVEQRPRPEPAVLPDSGPLLADNANISEYTRSTDVVRVGNALSVVPSMLPAASAISNSDNSTPPVPPDFGPNVETKPSVQQSFASFGDHRPSRGSSEALKVPAASSTCRNDKAMPNGDESIPEPVTLPHQNAETDGSASSPTTQSPWTTGNAVVCVGHGTVKYFLEYFTPFVARARNLEVFVLSCFRVYSHLLRVRSLIAQTWVPIREMSSNAQGSYRNLSTDNRQDTASPVPSHDVAMDPAQWDLKVSHDKPFNFASNDAGARVLAASANAVGSKNVLNSNPDMYMLVPCEGDGVGGSRWIDIELSEDAVLTSFETANFEFYSSFPRSVAVLGATSYPPKVWNTVAVFDMASVRHMQQFLIPGRTVARYLRIVYVGKQGSEFYCPISVIRVFGKTLLADWKDELDGAPEASYSPAPSRTGRGTVEPAMNLGFRESSVGTMRTEPKTNDDPVVRDDDDFRISDVASAPGDVYAGGSENQEARRDYAAGLGSDGTAIKRPHSSRTPKFKVEPAASKEQAGVISFRLQNSRPEPELSTSDVRSGNLWEGENIRRNRDEFTAAQDEHDLQPEGCRGEFDDPVAVRNKAETLPDQNRANEKFSPTEPAGSPAPDAAITGHLRDKMRSNDKPSSAEELSEEDINVLKAVREDILSPVSSEENVFRKVTRMIRVLELNQSLTNQYIDTHLSKYASALSQARADAVRAREDAAVIRSQLSQLTSSHQASLRRVSTAALRRDMLMCVLLVLVALLVGSQVVLWTALTGVQLSSGGNEDEVLRVNTLSNSGKLVRTDAQGTAQGETKRRRRKSRDKRHSGSLFPSLESMDAQSASPTDTPAREPIHVLSRVGADSIRSDFHDSRVTEARDDATTLPVTHADKLSSNSFGVRGSRGPKRVNKISRGFEVLPRSNEGY